MMYLQDNDERFPVVLNGSANFDMSGGANLCENGKVQLPGYNGQEPQFQFVSVMAPYVKNSGVWYCPSVGPDYVWEPAVKAGAWKKGATMKHQGTTYWYNWCVFPSGNWSQQIFLGGKSLSILQAPSRWPMLHDLPGGWLFAGNLGDPPTSAVPHSGGLNVAYGDGHAKYYRLEAADGTSYPHRHAGDGIYADQ